MNITLTDEQVDEIIRQNLSLEGAVDFIEAQEEGVEYALESVTYKKDLKAHLVAPLITFENCNEVARLLSIDDRPTAVGLKDELIYWTVDRPVGKIS